MAIDIPPEWPALDLRGVQGVLMVLGAVNAGKSTFARYLFERLHRGEGASPPNCVAFLDGDPGQSVLGPPTTLTLVFGAAGGEPFPPGGQAWRYFVGATTPRGHMLPALVGCARLVGAARQAVAGGGALTVIHDTSGLIDPTAGGLSLKSAKIELLQPTILFAIQRENELEPLLRPWRKSRRVRVVDLRPSPAATSRSADRRRSYRREAYRRYFAAARLLGLDTSHLAVFPAPRLAPRRLVALEDRQGFTLALGIVAGYDRQRRRVELLTPLEADELARLNALRLGDLELDPETFVETAR